MNIPTLEEMDDAIEGLLELFQSDIEKANPYRDEFGRFTSADKAVAPSGKKKTGKSKSKSLDRIYKPRQGETNYENRQTDVWRKGDSVEYAVAYYRSQVGFHGSINAKLRQSKGKSANSQPIVKAIDRAFLELGEKTTKQIVVYRGAELSAKAIKAIGVSEERETGKLIVSGTKLIDHGIISTSKNQSVAVGFAQSWKPTGKKQVLFKIKVPPKTNILSIGGKEEEILLKRGTAFKVARAYEGLLGGNKQSVYGTIGARVYGIIIELEAVSP